MTRTKQTSKKREKEKGKQKKKKEKEQRKEDRKKHSSKGLGLDAFVIPGIEPEQEAGKVLHDPGVDMHTATEVKTGKIVYLNMLKGYGYIRNARVKETLFFSTGDLGCEVRLDDMVTFTRTKSSHGGSAISIEKLYDTSA